MPIGLHVPDGKDAAGRDKWEAVANGDDGVPLGREIEVSRLLSEIKRAGIKNVVWLTADVHYTAAHFYDPAKAKFSDFFTVLGICFCSSELGQLWPQQDRRHIWHAGDVPKSAARTKHFACGWHAVFWSGRH